MHAQAGCGEHGEGCLKPFALERAIERVGPEHDVRILDSPRRTMAEHVAAPARQRSFRRKTEHALAKPRRAGQGVAEV